MALCMVLRIHPSMSVIHVLVESGMISWKNLSCCRAGMMFASRADVQNEGGSLEAQLMQDAVRSHDYCFHKALVGSVGHGAEVSGGTPRLPSSQKPHPALLKEV